MPRSSRSGWPLTARTALENSPSAEALIRCTENASATPSITATTAAALRQGWWRSSCQEKVRNRASMQALCRWRRQGREAGLFDLTQSFREAGPLSRWA
jgi:hypothetical protein